MSWIIHLMNEFRLAWSVFHYKVWSISTSFSTLTLFKVKFFLIEVFIFIFSKGIDWYIIVKSNSICSFLNFDDVWVILKSFDNSPWFSMRISLQYFGSFFSQFTSSIWSNPFFMHRVFFETLVYLIMSMFCIWWFMWFL